LFFKAALSGNWVEAKDRLVKLPEDEPTVFADYVHFLYTRKLHVKSHKASGESSGHDEKISLLKLYVLAEKLQDADTKRAVMGAVFNCFWGICITPSEFPGLECIEIVYGGTPAGSPLRRILVDFYTYYARDDTLKQYVTYPNEFMQELAIDLLKKRAKPTDRAAMFKDPSVYMGMIATITLIK
jgi:hypothetical protein